MATEPEQAQAAPVQAPLPSIALKMIKTALLTEAIAREINERAIQENRSFYLQCIEQNAVPVLKAAELMSQ